MFYRNVALLKYLEEKVSAIEFEDNHYSLFEVFGLLVGEPDFRNQCSTNRTKSTVNMYMVTSERSLKEEKNGSQ